MNPRELVILLLGLAIVAVVLRGLYVALQARRGQIRLAIDKNIPKNVDLEALEMAELPSGGARVVRRGTGASANSEVAQADKAALARANVRAAELDLGENEDVAVPVLMDAVQINDRGASDQPHDEVELEDDEFGYSADREEVYETDEEPLPEAEPENSIADESEELASVAPDYYDENAEAEDEDSDEGDPQAELDDTEYDDYEEDYEEQELDERYDAEDDSLEDAYDEDEQAYEDEDIMADEQSGERAEPSLGNFDDDLDDFSMSAGERIGFEHKASPVSKAEIAEGDGENSASEADESKGGFGSSIRSALSRWSASAAERRSQKAELKAELKAEKETRAAQEAEARAAAAEAAQQNEAEEPAQDTLLDYSVGEEAQAPAAEQEQWAPEHQEMEPQQLDIEPAPSHEQDYASAGGETDAPASEDQPAEVLVVNVMAKEGYAFAGDDLMHTLITSGLKFGDMNIFHQRLGNQPKGPVIFSVANILNPGSFDLNAMDTFTTVGVSLFLALPSPINNLDAFEKMLNVAQQLCSTLGGDLRDDSRNLMTAQTIEHYRQRVRDFELRQLKAAGGRG